jgi:hypothetical protein
MNNILSREAKSLCQWITRVSCRKIMVLTVLILLKSTIAYCQSDHNVNEETRAFIFMSIEIDRPYGYNIVKWEDMLKVLKNHHDFLQIDTSSIFNFILPKSLDSIADGYSLQLYKMVSVNSRKQSRYLLRYDGFEGIIWLRVAGYVENDLKVFFDYLRKKGVKKKDLKKIVEEWEDSDFLFKEIDFKCLLKGYTRNQTSSDCFIAVSYVEVNDLSIGFDPISENDIYGVFSRIPLIGRTVIATKWW